ncbi:hypothetical protein RF55_25159 [Lasius niger]|uniref:Uncharacterized protein n=2 Tax=cellular organisms TaxID=131567 RepID=A0A0J7JUH0_LASNI|nr:hypothetical protein RF55_25159 [Lasius niger]
MIFDTACIPAQQGAYGCNAFKCRIAKRVRDIMNGAQAKTDRVEPLAYGRDQSGIKRIIGQFYGINDNIAGKS